MENEKNYRQKIARGKGRSIDVHLDMNLIRHASWTLAGIALMLCCMMPEASAQKTGDGLWNAGGSFVPVPAQHADSLQVRALLARVRLYPGFALVRTDLDILNTGKDTLYSGLRFTDSATVDHPVLLSISNLPPLTRMVLLGKDTLPADGSIRFVPGIRGTEGGAQPHQCHGGAAPVGGGHHVPTFPHSWRARSWRARSWRAGSPRAEYGDLVPGRSARSGPFQKDHAGKAAMVKGNGRIRSRAVRES